MGCWPKFREGPTLDTAVFDSLVKSAESSHLSTAQLSSRHSPCPILPHTDLSIMQTLLLPATAVAAGSCSTSRLHRPPTPAFHVPSFSFPLPNLPSSSKTFQPLSFHSPSYGATHHRRTTLSFAVRASQVSSPAVASPDGEGEKAKLAQVLTPSFFLSDFNLSEASNMRCWVAVKMLENIAK